MNAESSCLSLEDQERRGDYRLHYSAGLCPLFRLDGHQQKVLDISAAGLRFDAKEGGGLRLGTRIQVAVHFGNGEVEMVAGNIIRVGYCDAAAWLEQGFTSDVMAREHDRQMSFMDGTAPAGVSHVADNV